MLAHKTEGLWQFLAPVYSSSQAGAEDNSPFSAPSGQIELLGFVQITLSKQSLQHTQRELFVQNISASLLFSLVLYVLLRLIIAKVTRPLNKLAATMGTAEMGEDKIRAEIDGPLEVRNMAFAFNNMMTILELRDKSLRQQRDTLESQVAERTQELVLARDQALEASRHKSEFLANVSHELRTPMNAVIGYTDILIEELEEQGDEAKVADLQRIHAAGRHLLGLINNILDLTKVEAGRMELALEPTCLQELMNGVTGMLRPLFENKNNRLQVDITNLDGKVLLDPGKLRQIMLNLLSNANKFTQDGDITVHMMRDEQGLYISVSDTGIGIPKGQQINIFEAFRQGDMSTTRKYGGTGLGLTITQRFCRLMGGDIEVHSEPGKVRVLRCISRYRCRALVRNLHYPPMAYKIGFMEFIETRTFTRMVTSLLSDDEYRELQNELLDDPERGDIIKGGGGIRKLRYAVPGRGKSGGLRVIYYWVKDNHQIYMLVVYPKSRKDNLSDKETAVLRNYVKEL
ncbi:MAG: ATP-binding protein [Gammaproteobacteria bacterium]